MNTYTIVTLHKISSKLLFKYYFLKEFQTKEKRKTLPLGINILAPEIGIQVGSQSITYSKWR